MSDHAVPDLLDALLRSVEQARAACVTARGYRGPVDQDGHAVIEPRTIAVPGSWWVASDGRDDAVWAPGDRPSQPMVLAREHELPGGLWTALLRGLPRRGDCDRCTAVACPDHYEPED